MITNLKKLTANNKEFPKNQLKKIRGLGIHCAGQCDGYCGTQKGNDGNHYSDQRSFWEFEVHN